MRVASLICLFVLLLSCASKSASSRPEQDKVPSYSFGYAPYDAVAGVDRSLYNYLFNIFRNKMVYYVQQTFPRMPEPVGMILELEGSDTANYEASMQSSIRRGWYVFDTDVLTIPPEDLTSINEGSLTEKLVQTPKTSFAVRVNGANAIVNVRYWVLQYWNYNFIYYVEKISNWTVVRTELLQ